MKPLPQLYEWSSSVRFNYSGFTQSRRTDIEIFNPKISNFSSIFI